MGRDAIIITFHNAVTSFPCEHHIHTGTWTVNFEQYAS